MGVISLMLAKASHLHFLTKKTIVDELFNLRTSLDDFGILKYAIQTYF